MSTLEHRLLWMMLAQTGKSPGHWIFDKSDFMDPVGEIVVHWLPNGEVEVIAEPAEEPAPEVPADPQAYIIKGLYDPPWLAGVKMYHYTTPEGA